MCHILLVAEGLNKYFHKFILKQPIEDCVDEWIQGLDDYIKEGNKNINYGSQ